MRNEREEIPDPMRGGWKERRMNQCPKCKSFMRWYAAAGYGFSPQWRCDNCGYDTADIRYTASNRTDCVHEKVFEADGEKQV